MRSFHKSLLAIAVSSTSLIFTGCSDSDSVSGEEINGSVFASYVNGATVTVTDESGNVIAGPASTNAQGEFSVRIPASNLSDNLIFTATGGQYKDEATGETTTNTSLSAFLMGDSLSGGSDIQFSLSPDSTIVEGLISDHGLTRDTARTYFENAFGYTPNCMIVPVDATEENADAEEEQKLAGLRAAAFSQMTNDLGLPAASQGALLELLAQDIADNSFDGMSNDLALEIGEFTASTDLQNHFSQAFINFHSSDDNASGLTNNKIGKLPFSKVAISDSYIVTFVPSEMMIKHGKSEFQLVITDKEGTPATGLSPMLMPMMHMQMHNHSTPKLMVTESDTAGTYNATLFYVMPSIEDSGNSMGYWNIKVMLGEESVNFYPRVMRASGDTAHARLRGQDDSMPNMSGSATKRPYEVFKNSISIDENGADFSVFISTRDSMMNFPALATGLVLNEGSEDYELTVSDIAVEMSSDEETWTNATSDGNGFWSADDLDIANDDSEQSIYVRLTVNGEQKTDDGQASDGTADNATFIINASSDSDMGMDMGGDDHGHMHM